ncbi:MAG: IMP dehydrogenase [Armatimonadetes bacterium]|nr:IMP dehydrogenase [Armatimonadota bacterium]
MAREPIRVGLTFDDVLLVPRRSGVTTRSAVDTATRLTRQIEMAIPVVSANMDAVTESEMAIALARAGGIGVIHRFLPIDRHAAEVRRVKRAESVVIERPYTFSPGQTIREAIAFMEEHGAAGLLVVDADGTLLGLVTARDLLFEDDLDQPVSSVMTPRARLVTAPPDVGIDEARAVLHRHRLEKLPLIDGEGKLRGLITSRDIQSRLKYPHATKDAKGRLRTGAAVGIRGDYMERAAAVVVEGADVLVMDVAHAHTEAAIEALVRLRQAFPDVSIVAGNVATAEGTRDLIARGADAVKVGVGPGSTCTTRVVTGAGVPQLTAVLDCAQAAADHGIPLIADGGIRNSGDMTKALAAGASSVMLGNLLAGTQESPGALIVRNGRQYKTYRGMASLWAAARRRALETPVEEEDISQIVAEGVEAMVPYRGKAADVLAQLVGGLRSGMSYCGARVIPELWEKAEFMHITVAGLRESLPHDVEPT